MKVVSYAEDVGYLMVSHLARKILEAIYENSVLTPTMIAKRKGYRVERKIRILFEKNGWRVIRAGGSLGEADLVCLKRGKVIFLQIKSTKKDQLYYYGYRKSSLEGFPFYVVVDFGYGKIRILKPKRTITKEDGEDLSFFLERFK